jgi:AraC-like DNA-binding protein
MMRVTKGADHPTLSQKTENLQRVGPIACIPALLRRLAVDPEEVLLAAGLDAHALDDPNGTITFKAMGLVAERSAALTRCPHFGLEIGPNIRLATLGVLGEWMRNAPTLRAALNDFANNQHRNAHGSVVYLIESGRDAFFGYAIYQPDVAGTDVICDAVAMGLFTIVRELLGVGSHSAPEVLLSRTTPSNIAPYSKSFGVRLSFNNSQTAVKMPRALLDQPVMGADAGRRMILAKQVHETYYAGDLDTVTRLRRELRVAMLNGSFSATEVAAHLGMSQRTLHRRLQQWGIGFQEIIDETRCELAKQLLANTRLSIGEIAEINGYHDPSILTRGFTRWVGVTPSQWRAKFSVTAYANRG